MLTFIAYVLALTIVALGINAICATVRRTPPVDTRPLHQRRPR